MSNYIAAFEIPKRYKIAKAELIEILRKSNEGDATVAGFASVCRMEGTRVKINEEAFLTWYRQYQHEQLDRRLNQLKADREQYYVQYADRTRT